MRPGETALARAMLPIPVCLFTCTIASITVRVGVCTREYTYYRTCGTCGSIPRDDLVVVKI